MGDVQPKKLTKNLASRFTKANAVEIGRRGGRSKSLRKKLSSRLNAIKHGRHIKQDEVGMQIIRKAMPKPHEKIFGVTFGQKITQIKMISAFAGAENALEYIDALRIGMAEYELIVKSWELSVEKKHKPVSPFHRNAFMNTALKFGELAYGLGPKNALIDPKEKTVEELSHTALLRRILGYDDKIVEAEFREGGEASE